MLRKGVGKQFYASVNSANWVTVAEASTNINRFVVAIHNTYTGANLDELEIQVLIQIAKDGEFFDVGTLEGNGGVVWQSSGLKKGMTHWGVIGDFGVIGVKVQARRAGPDPIPVIVGFKILVEGWDG